MTGFSVHDTGITIAANMATLNGECAHHQTAPVELIATGELVARLCVSCLREVPIQWGSTR